MSVDKSAVPDTIALREASLLAPYAMHSRDSRRRRWPEASHAYRGPFQRDRDRIVHSAAFRRLSHKTQVFTGPTGDYHRSRMTHTLEVSSIARTVGRALRLNEDLIEALALLHDIGHPPFGHAGEETLAELTAEHGGFNHNTHAVRIVERIERRYAGFPGLNLSHEVISSQQSRATKNDDDRRPLLEAQVVDAADSIAYDSHDADDALELGLVSLDELLENSLWSEGDRRVRKHCRNVERRDLRRAIVHELIDRMVSDLVQNAQRRITEHDVQSVDEALHAPRLIVPTDELADRKAELERFLHERVYRHKTVMTVRLRSQQELRTMFHHFLARPDRLPDRYRGRVPECGLQRSVCDYLAGMTDRYATTTHRRIVEQSR